MRPIVTDRVAWSVGLSVGLFVFQQDNAPTHHARDTVELLRCETPQFISPGMWPGNSPDLNRVDNRVRGML